MRTPTGCQFPPTCSTHRLPPADRAGMGIRLPLGHGDQLLLRTVDRALGQVRMVSSQQRGSCLVVRRACFRTTWGCSTCWGTSLNGCKTASSRTMPEGSRHRIDIISLEYMHDNIHRVLRGGVYNILPTGDRSALRWGTAPSYRYTDLGFRPARTYP